MKLIRCGPVGAEFPGLLLPDGRAVRVPEEFGDFGEAFFGAGGLDRLAGFAAGAAADAPEIPAGTRRGPPIARPSKIVCVGLNYREHAAETGARIPDEPVLFQKATSAWSGPEDDLVLPPGSERTDWEVELAVAIGRQATRVTEAEAPAFVAGYGILIDYSERAWQKERGGQWTKGKSADGFAPFGPWLATADEVPDPGNLPLRLSVNGTVMQESSTADLVFPVPFLIAYISRFMTLLPGDIVSTGTPSGVGLGRKPPVFLKPGDIVESEIPGLGSQRQRVVASPEDR